ncbi:MAG: ComEC/Rec2 family competence protein [Candidatus Paceibacterota bacterium]
MRFQNSTLSILFIGLTIWAIRFYFIDLTPPQIFESHVGEKVKFSGIVADAPSIRNTNTRFLVGVETEKEFKVLVTSVNAEVEYGDEVEVTGTLKKAVNFVTDQGKEFDYVNYLKKDNVLYTVSFAKVEVLSKDHGNVVKRYLFKVKNFFLDRINLAIPPPESHLLAGLVLGEKSNFSQELNHAFIKTGTIHIVALSGYNVTIVAEWIMSLFAFLGASSIYFGMFGIFLFVLMTGGASTGIRAGIMAVLALLARKTGRMYDAGRGLVLAGVIMIIWNPMILIYDVSFQLSFLATFFVIYITPRTLKYFYWAPERFGIRDIVNVTTTVYLFMLPFILYKMGNLSLVALPANFLILPFIPITMLLGFLTGFVGMIAPIVSLLPGYITSKLLGYELFIIEQFARVPFASLTISRFPLILVLLIYAWFAYKLFWQDIKNIFKNKEEINW